MLTVTFAEALYAGVVMLSVAMLSAVMLSVMAPPVQNILEHIQMLHLCSIHFHSQISHKSVIK
jgi:hypothetical protein